MHDVTQVALGAVLASGLMRLPLKLTVPVLGSDFGPAVNVVADMVMRQPAPDPVLSVAVSCWSPATASTAL